jgi:hypothetical protein
LININEGIHDTLLEFANDQYWDFRVIAPSLEADSLYPLAIDLHGASGGSGILSLMENMSGLNIYPSLPSWMYIKKQEMSWLMNLRAMNVYTRLVKKDGLIIST